MSKVALRLNTEQVGLADRVRLLAHNLRRQSGGEVPSESWVLALDSEDGNQATQEYGLLLPSRQPLADEVSATADTPPVVEAESAIQIEIPADDEPFSQPPRLRAPILAVVAADFKPAPESTRVAERVPIVEHLTLEDYAPLQPLAAEPWLPLAPRTRWWPALRRFTPQVSGGIDLPRLVNHFANLRPLQQLPRLQRRSRFRSLLVLWDARRSMLPYRRDIEMLLDCLKAQRQAMTMSVEKFGGLPPRVPKDVDAVFLLSDLGLCTTPDPAAAVDAWARWARAMKARGIAIQVWLPMSAQRIPAKLALAIPCVPWHENSHFRPTRGRPSVAASCTQQRNAWMAQLWPLLAIAQRIEPALLRRARLLAGGQGQPEWEAVLWQTSGEHVAGERVLQLWPARAPEWRHRFSQLSTSQQLQVWHAFTEQHGHLARSTLVIEQLVWGAYARPEARNVVCDSLVRAQDWLRKMKIQEVSNSTAHQQALQTGEDHALHSSFLHGLVTRNAVDAAFTARYAEDYAPLALAIGRMEGSGVAAEAWVGALSQSIREQSSSWSLLLHHTSNESIFEQCFWPANTDVEVSGLISQTILPVCERHASLWKPLGKSAQWLKPLSPGEPGELYFGDLLGMHRIRIDYLKRADWQHALGCDRYGVFCEVEVKKIRLRFRYMPPGTFLQGSAHGVIYNEHPQHPVTITREFWLAETPCTQELWQAVMGKNPSYFTQGEDAPRRPVESVSWNDVQAFFNLLQPLLPSGCEAALPTESQWEYACRAGSQTEYWWGDEVDEAKANFDIIGQRQWDDINGTSPVDRYPPNRWGLYDMHGNVWEWCFDSRREYADSPELDPEGPSRGRFRVVRGGSWINRPGEARAACRGSRSRGGISKGDGFRFALRPLSGPEVRLEASGAGRFEADGSRIQEEDAFYSLFPQEDFPSEEPRGEGIG